MASTKHRKTRVWKRKAKAERRNNKLWAEGAREDLLRPHIEAYADALQRGWRAERDYLQKVCNEYHGRISWRVGDNDEPELPLPEYDPFAPIVTEDLTEEERVARQNRIVELNARIQRWLKYRAQALRQGFATKTDPRNNPYAVLLAKISGVTVPPKTRQVYQQFMHESYTTEIAPLVEERWRRDKSTNEDGSANTKKPDAAFRSLIAREVFDKLPAEEKVALKERALAHSKEAKDAYEAAMKNGPSKEPAARQKCIDEIGRFLAPILEGVQSYTGLQGVCVFGGPIPKNNGEIGTTHVAVGTNRAPMPVGFAGWNRPRFAREIVGFFSEYLHTAYCGNAGLCRGCAALRRIAGRREVLLRRERTQEVGGLGPGAFIRL
ncbi:hypothetical protein DFH06DRAFT_1128165 [Mycena polygramma]|nr:hypothetical protein DFH06DRAFT_1128165 [Mycena polygramma]